MLGDLRIRDALPCDGEWFATRLRACDLQEVRALIGRHGDLEGTLRRSIELSPIVKTVVGPHGPVFVIGCAPGEHGCGNPWLVATDAVAAYPTALTKITKQSIKEFMKRWPRLMNYADERNTVTLRWLERLGFRVHEPVAVGVLGEHFRPFTMGF